MITPVYLNNAGQARIDEDVQEKGVLQISKEPWAPHAIDDQQKIRSLFADLIRASAQDIAIMPCTSFAISFAASNVKQFNSSGKILLIEDQMCSAVFPWQDLSAETDGAFRLSIVPYPIGKETWTGKIVEAIEKDKSISVACLPPLHWCDGSVIDLVEIGLACRRSGIILIVDATQAVGVVDCNVQAIKPAMLACSVHKWLRAPSGVSLVYVDSSLHGVWQPIDHHGRSRTSFHSGVDPMGPSGYPPEQVTDARKFDGGGKPNPILMPMLRLALEQVVNINFDETRTQLQTLVTPLLEWAERKGIHVPNPVSYHLIGLRPKNITPARVLEICSLLAQQGIYIAGRCGAFRISPYIDNTEDDIIALVNALDSILVDELV